jgi:hypothetical protein
MSLESGFRPRVQICFDGRPPIAGAFTGADGTVVDTQTPEMARLKAAQAAGKGAGRVDPITPEMAALKAAQAAGKPLMVDPQPAALAELKR